MSGKDVPLETQPIRVLMVEDDELDYELTAARLAEVPAFPIELERAATYEQGLDAIGRCRHDAYLIDYRLGHRDGVELLREARRTGCDAPMIMLTGQGSDRIDLEAMRAGASDYVVKGGPDPSSLARSIRYAVERHRLLSELERERQLRRQERELLELARMAGPGGAAGGMTITAEALGLRPLREAMPGAFDRMVRRFGDLLDTALEQRAYKTESDPTAPQLRALAEQLGSARAGPADVIEVYTSALRAKLAASPGPKAEAYMQEGRAMALGLMGYLAAYYRAYCVAPRAGAESTEGARPVAPLRGREECG
jgi:DNA-binding NarL/FixJ family response regulator